MTDKLLNRQIALAMAVTETDCRIFLNRSATDEELAAVAAQVRKDGFFNPLGGIDEFLTKVYKEQGVK